MNLVLGSPKESNFFRAQFWHLMKFLPAQGHVERSRNGGQPPHPSVTANLLSVQDKSCWGGKSPWASRHEP